MAVIVDITGNAPVNGVMQTCPVQAIEPTPITGRYLSHNWLDPVKRAFLGADLVFGVRYLVDPTIAMAAKLAGTCPSYVHAAIKHYGNRELIEDGVLPLLPAPKPRIVTINETADEFVLKEMIARIGIQRALEIAVEVERMDLAAE